MIGNLKFYSEFSLEYGSIKIKELLKYCKKNNYSYLCITDRFNISGSYQFFKNLSNNNVKPLLGCELYVKINFNKIKTLGNITVIAKNLKGYKEICKIISTKEVQLKKIINIKKVLKFKNIYILSGGYGGIYTNLNKKFCFLLTKILKKINKNFFIEIQRFNKKSFIESKFLISVSKKTKVNLVATHPIRYLRKNDYFSHFYKYCILKKIFLNNKKRYKNNFFISSKKIINNFKDITISLKNSFLISKKCSFDFNKKNNNFFLKKKYKKNFFLLLKKKLKKIIYNFKKKKKKIYKKRLLYEYKIIKEKKFIDYFIIVSDFVKWAKINDIQVGPGRGSCSSSLVSYLLRITEVDPIKNDLIFERFLNKKKNSLPDFDIDFCKKKRKYVIDYIKKKYSIKKVANLVTFGRFSLKNSIKDSGRILGYNFSYLNKLSNKINFKKKYKSFKEILFDLDIKKKYKNDKKFIKILKISLKIDGYLRNIGVHSGGIIITNKYYYNYFPVYYLKKEKTIVSQFNKYDIEDMGFLKFDILGLNTLTILKNILNDLKIKFSFLKLNLKDNKTFNLIKKGNTTGVFQLESKSLKYYLKIIKPNNFFEVVNIISLYRPGPMYLIKDYCRNKYKKNNLKETRGIIIFQEQLIKIIEKNFNINTNEADIFRTALSKGNNKEILKIKKKIKNKYKKNKIVLKNKLKIFKYVKKFSGYCFNKAHAVSYSILTFSMAFLKANFKESFFISNFNFSFNNKKKLKNLYIDCIKNNIFFYPPDINYSKKYFYKYCIFNKTKIISGFLFIKGIGINAIKEIIKKRKKGYFMSFSNFLYRVKKNIINSRIIKNLIYSGCFDNFNKRSELIIQLKDYFSNNINQIKINEKKKKIKINIFIKEKKNIYFYFSDFKRNLKIKKNRKEKNIFIGILKKIKTGKKVENNYFKIIFLNNNEKIKNKIIFFSFIKILSYKSKIFLKKIYFLK
ncbi:DNA polymerase III subunit alpha [Candidatus Vidania fulgoroideorum]